MIVFYILFFVRDYTYYLNIMSFVKDVTLRHPTSASLMHPNFIL